MHTIPSIALCIITSDADADKAIALAKGLHLKGAVDSCYITFTGKERRSSDYDHIVDSYFEWCDDFSAARNFNFSQAKEDYILWLDADDTLEHPEKLRKLVDQAETLGISGYWTMYKYAFDENGNCTDMHWKAQLLKNDGHFRWAGKIHEDPIQLKAVKWAKTFDITRVHHSTEERGKQSFERNLRILENSHKEDPNEPRTMFYLGRTYAAMKEYKKAIGILQKYLEKSGWDDERYEARLLIGQCYVALDDFDTALLAYNDALLEKETNPDAYIYKGICYLNKEQWENALYNLNLSLTFDIPDAVTYFNPMFYRRDVYASIAIANLQLSRLTDAWDAIQLALKEDPKQKENLELAGFIKAAKEKHDTARKYAELAKYLDSHKGGRNIPTLLSTVPADLIDNEIVLALRNRFMPPTKWPNKSIAVFCGTSAEDWTPDNMNTGGIGGSETAVIELTNRLAKMGWKVTVFNQGNHPPEGQYFGDVEYQNYWKFNVKDEFDVLWVWRLPEMFDYDLQARVKILDLHDVMNPLDFTPERVARMDKIFVKTNFHRSLFPNVEDEKFVVVGNGIDLSRFNQCTNCSHSTGVDKNGVCDYCGCDTVIKKDPYRFCYTSSPNRGLEPLLTMWPKIKEALPEATLHVYYGWNTFYQLEKNNPERMLWMKKMQKMMEQPGVINHGRVGQKELAQDLLKTSFWLYPTDFPEIDCITAKEMQAARVTPITTGYAALEESQKCGVKLPGDIYDPEWQKQYIQAVLEAKPKSIDASIFSWDLVSKKWNEVCV